MTKSFHILYGILYVGFFFHRSEHPVLFGYSLPYLGTLVALATPFLLPHLLSRIGWIRWRAQALSFCAVALGTVVLIEPLVATTDFDPFTNLPVPRIADRTRADGEQGILVIGISTSKRYPPELETHLKREGRHVRVLSQAQIAQTVKHQLIGYVSENREVEADVAVVMFGTQSLFRSFIPVKFAEPPYRSDWSHNYGEAVVGHRRDNIVSLFLRRHAGPLAEAWASSLRQIQEEVPLEAFISRPDYRRYYRSLLKTLTDDGRKVLVCGELFMWKPDMTAAEQKACWITRENAESRHGILRVTPDHLSLARAMRDYNRIARETAAEFGCAWLDTDGLVPRDLAHFKDDIHLNATGRHLLVRAIHGRLDELGWLRP